MMDTKRIAVVGATGQVGSQITPLLEAAGHRVTPASRSTGIDAAIGTGLADALRDVDVLVDVLNSPTTEDDAALAFFTGTSANLAVAARMAGVRHYVLLSIVGIDRFSGGGYQRGKLLQEETIAASGVPYTVVRATQFHELTGAITDSLIIDGEVRAPDALIEPIASADVATVLARVATAAPVNGRLDLGGPERMSFADMATTVLASRGDARPVSVDPTATYFATPIRHNSMITGDDAEHATTRLADWLAALERY